MLSENASAQAGHSNSNGQPAARPVGEALPALGFEPSQGGQSYGLEEVSDSMDVVDVHPLMLLHDLHFLQLAAQNEPAFSIGRVQVSWLSGMTTMDKLICSMKDITI